MKSWFEVDRKGLKALQDGKPLSWIAREVIANAFDEAGANHCTVSLTQKEGMATLSVWDNSPEGFQNLKDAYTLFGETSKRKNPLQRGRFNLGEKQALARCESGEIKTTKGSVIFNKEGRKTSTSRTLNGSKIILKFKATQKETGKILEDIKSYIAPRGMHYEVNEESMPHKKVDEIFTASLLTEELENGIMRRKHRQAEVKTYNPNGSVPLLYEMGIPVQEIPDSKFSIDVQQKVPLSTDRDSVPTSYLKDLFAEVLNNTFNKISEEESSQGWIRKAFESNRIENNTVKTIVQKRYGDKVLVSTPGNPVANDDALANGYRVIQSRELSKEEWQAVKGADCIKSTQSQFGKSPTTNFEYLELDFILSQYKIFVANVAYKTIGKYIDSCFIKSKETLAAASFEGSIITFNVSVLGKKFFETPASQESLNLIIHEIGHEFGHHTEAKYHEALTRIGSILIQEALENPEFFGTKNQNRRDEICECGKAKSHDQIICSACNEKIYIKNWKKTIKEKIK